ncbi:MAG: response regulator [Bacteroidales bacterium]|nr:response regulator [Bacteroidales bacterium]
MHEITNRPKRILIVEDHEVSLELLEDLLTPPEFECHAAPDGITAIRKLKENEYDIVIMDILLPDINGLEIVREFRKTNTDSYVIAISAYPRSETEATCIEAGCNEFIGKPYDIEALLLKLIKFQVRHQG